MMLDNRVDLRAAQRPKSAESGDLDVRILDKDIDKRGISCYMKVVEVMRRKAIDD
jgi:hypothetical protein